MKVAYVSLDEVHEDLARRMTHAKGLGLEVFWPTETIPRQQFQVVIYDLDHLSAVHRELVQDKLMRGRATAVVAVHGYNLTQRQANMLRENGILVSRRLGRKLLARVKRTAILNLVTTG